MTKNEILEYFKDINYAYNDCMRYDTLKRMLDELQEPCDDAISRQNATAQCFQAMELISGEFECELSSEKKSYNAGLRKAIEVIRALPPVNPAEKVGRWIDAEVLNKIRAEIIELRSRQNVGVLECLDIIDKYKASQTGEEVEE